MSENLVIGLRSAISGDLQPRKDKARIKGVLLDYSPDTKTFIRDAVVAAIESPLFGQTWSDTKQKSQISTWVNNLAAWLSTHHGLRAEIGQTVAEIWFIALNSEKNPSGSIATESAVGERVLGVPETEIDLEKALQAENIVLTDKLMRALAETENLRRRVVKEVEDAREFAIASFARDMLHVFVSIQSTLDSLPVSDRKNVDASTKKLIEGVETIERGFLNQLSKHGIEQNKPTGQKFDPDFHVAMFEVLNSEVPNDTVVQVIRSGFIMGNRVLLPAMVGISKNAPKQKTSFTKAFL